MIVLATLAAPYTIYLINLAIELSNDMSLCHLAHLLSTQRYKTMSKINTKCPELLKTMSVMV